MYTPWSLGSMSAPLYNRYSVQILGSLKQPRRRRQQELERHKFAYLTMKNSSFACFARAVFIFGHLADVLVLSTKKPAFFIVQEEGWFGQPKYSAPEKNPSTLCRLLLLFSSFYT